MKKVYWRPQSLPIVATLFIAALALAGMLSVEVFKTHVRQPHYGEKIQAARLAQSAMEAIQYERLKRGLTIDPETDPARSGLIGTLVTPVTSDAGDLNAKQTSVNPNFAAVIVTLLARARVREGDRVAVSFSGSFPALNICVLSAISAMKLKPVIISGASGSQWGANDPNFLWIDMETFLNKKGFFPFRSEMASIGGRNDRGKEMTDKGRELILQAIKRNDLAILEAKTIRENVDRRIALYFRDRPPSVFINVGGGIAAAGVRTYKVFMKPGLLSQEVPGAENLDSVIARFLREQIPVIHLGNIRQLAEHYGLPVAPTTTPSVGEGRIYTRKEYNRPLAAGILAAIFLALFLLVRSDRGFRMMQALSRKQEEGPPELMI
jgi:poly-gamma-glutamate system protein